MPGGVHLPGRGQGNGRGHREIFRGDNPVLLLKKEAESYLRTKERGFLATMGKKGPTVIPVCFAYESGKIYSAIDRKPKSGRGLARVKNIALRRLEEAIVPPRTREGIPGKRPGRRG
ncbi:MAG: hypothetical protein E6K96_05005 [Thaumarchaeota archaeon]|nr:MAG: hypothetical protein E6K96_05005 [Nitrososphaerota archaeon]